MLRPNITIKVMEELHELDKEFDAGFLEARQAIHSLHNLQKGSEKHLQSWTAVDRTIEDLRDKLKTYNLEIFELEKTARFPFARKAEQYAKELERLESELAFQRAPSARAQLFAGQPSTEGIDPDLATADQMLRSAKIINNTDIGILRDLNRELDDTRAIGGSTLERLRSDGDRLEEIQVDLAGIESNLTRATQTLKTFARRVASDKIVWLFVVLIVGLIVFAIVWSTLHPAVVAVSNSTTATALSMSM